MDKNNILSNTLKKVTPRKDSRLINGLQKGVQY
jgi:hypothetical protein